MQLSYIFCSVYLGGVVLLTTGQPNNENPTTLDDVATAQPESRPVNDSIRGGTRTSLKSVPYQAAILSSGECVGAGSIIGKKYILTSNFLTREYTRLQVRVGSENPHEGGQLLNVSRSIIHDDFDDLYGYDAVLLRLSRVIKFRKNVKPIRMATKQVKTKSSAVLSGISGAKQNIDNKVAVKKGVVYILDKKSCKEVYEGVHDESNFCTVPSSICACVNDFGAPLVQNNKLIGYFIGGSLCCEDSNPQLFGDVSTVRNWVLKVLKKDGYDPAKDNRFYFNQ